MHADIHKSSSWYNFFIIASHGILDQQCFLCHNIHNMEEHVASKYASVHFHHALNWVWVWLCMCTWGEGSNMILKSLFTQTWIYPKPNKGNFIGHYFVLLILLTRKGAMHNWNTLGENMELENYQTALWLEAEQGNVGRVFVRWYLPLHRTYYLVQFLSKSWRNCQDAICLHLVIVLNDRELRWLLFTCFSHHHGCPTRKYPFPFEKDAFWKVILVMEFYWNCPRKVFLFIDFSAGRRFADSCKHWGTVQELLLRGSYWCSLKHIAPTFAKWDLRTFTSLANSYHSFVHLGFTKIRFIKIYFYQG